MHLDSVIGMYLVLKKCVWVFFFVGVSCCKYLFIFFCELNTMYHCIIVTFIKQTINILTFLTENLHLGLFSLIIIPGRP